MAERRMFAKTIIDSDIFLDMPISARLLYYDLAMRADDDGFVNSPKKIMKFVGASVDDINILISRKFIIPFESGVVVIKHWRIHNYIRKDTYKETMCKEEKSLLKVDENNSYILEKLPLVNEPSTNRQRVVNEPSTQDRLGKDSIVKDRLYIGEPQKSAPKKPKHKYGEYKNVLLSDEDLDKLKNEFPNDWEERIERLSDYVASTGKVYKNHLATIRTWAKKDKDNPQQSSGYGKKESTRTWCTGNEPSAEEILGLV